MLTLQDTFWQLVRNLGRTVILVLASAMLAGCMAFYLSNIAANEEAINRLAETVPVEVRVVNTTGSQDWRININEFRAENFMSSPYLTDFTYTIDASGEYTPEAKATDTAYILINECETLAINSLDCIQAPDQEFTYMDGYDETMFQTDQPVGLIGTGFIERYGVQVGDEISVKFVTLEFIAEAGRDSILTDLGEQTVKIVGTYESHENPKDLLVPVDWLTGVMESQGMPLNYNTMKARLKDPRQLNVFKESIPGLNFMEPNPDAIYEDYTGAALVVKDQDYITAAEGLGQTVALFRRFQVPFFVLVLGMIVLAIFLIMRGSRRVIAISVSLGRSKFLSGLSCFLAAFLAELVGCALVFPVMLLLAGTSVVAGLMICGVFLLFACAGDGLALLLLLRFDAFTLLTAAE